MPWAALVIGILASAFCYGAVQLKSRFGYDDSLDAFGVHGIGGVWGALATGIFCFTPVAGLAIAGTWSQVGKQILGIGSAVGFAVGGTLLIAGVLQAGIGLRVRPAEEREGLDVALHGERGFHSELL